MKLKSGFKIGFALFLLILFFLVINLTDNGERIKSFFYLISEPIQKVFLKAGQNVFNVFQTISEIKILKSENEELKRQNQKLISEIISLQELKKENIALREALDIGLEKEFQLILAEVISKEILEDSILINKGRKDGVTEGLSVITSQKELIGRISQVNEKFSKILLISNRESSFDAKIYEKEIEGLVRGRENFQVFLELLPKDKEINTDDLVVTSRVGGIFPEGLLVGKIIEVKKMDVKPYQEAKISPFFSLRKMETVFIIKE